MAASIRSVLEWTFRDRTTGRIVVAQAPNLPLLLWILATVLRWLLDPHGRWGTAVSVVGTGALIFWAADEVVRGVNPWRRFLGTAVLLGLAATWAGSR
jgi:hypothetical protein